MGALVFIIKDKLLEILNTRKAYFAGLSWLLEDNDVIDIFEHEDDPWNNIKPIYSISLGQARYEDHHFNRGYEQFFLYKPESDIFREVHIAFVLNKTDADSSISMKMSYI